MRSAHRRDLALQLGATVWLVLGAGGGPAAAQTAPRGGAGETGPRAAALRIDAAVASVEYVAIPPGEFLMGCSGESECAANETPAHRVAITAGFEMARSEVTQELWSAVMGSNPSRFQAAGHPVEQVSWEDVQEFLAVLNGRADGWYYRLPTEAEWEYAARAGTAGPSYGPIDDVAWYAGNSGDRTHAVGGKQPNAWGLHDMLGNVWEWCQDVYAPDLYASWTGEPVTQPRGPETGAARALRGGSFHRFLWFVRAPARIGLASSDRQPHVGFRCVRQRRAAGGGSPHRP